MLENVRRQVHSSILRPVIHLFFASSRAFSSSGPRLAEKQTKGPVARPWRPTVDHADAAIKPLSRQWPKRQGRRQVVKVVMEYTNLSDTEVFVCNAALVEMLYFLGTIAQISFQAELQVLLL